MERASGSSCLIPCPLCGFACRLESETPPPEAAMQCLFCGWFYCGGFDKGESWMDIGIRSLRETNRIRAAERLPPLRSLVRPSRRGRR